MNPGSPGLRPAGARPGAPRVRPVHRSLARPGVVARGPAPALSPPPPGAYDATDPQLFWMNNRPFLLHRRVGKGGFGEVYRAEMMLPPDTEVSRDPTTGAFILDKDGRVEVHRRDRAAGPEEDPLPTEDKSSGPAASAGSIENIGAASDENEVANALGGAASDENEVANALDGAASDENEVANALDGAASDENEVANALELSEAMPASMNFFHVEELTVENNDGQLSGRERDSNHSTTRKPFSLSVRLWYAIV